MNEEFDCLPTMRSGEPERSVTNVSTHNSIDVNFENVDTDRRRRNR